VIAPSVSIVMPVFNRADLVSDSLLSVQRQSGVDAEIIVVDDGSTDATAEVVEEAARSDPRLKLVRAAHAGPAAARNRGIALATGEYLTFIDSDDLCPPGRLQRQIDKLYGHDDATAVVGAILYFDALDPTGTPTREARHVPHHNAALQSATFRTDAFRGFGPLDETLAFAEDVDMFLRLLEADARLILEDEVACYCRQHAGSMTNDVRGKQRGYVQAYARSIARRRAAGRTRPLTSFFPGRVEADTAFGGTHSLQEIDLTGEPDALPLYSRAEGDALRLDTFANSFYLSYWRELAGLRSLSLSAEVSGTGTLRLRHRLADGGETVLHSAAFDAPERRTLIVDIDPAIDGVLGIEVEGPATLHSGQWVTRDAPRAAVRLAIVICSFGEPATVRDNLRRLAEPIERLDSVTQVIVVHQGDGDLEGLRSRKLQLIEQPNFGGSGGFTRGMIEALETDATHVLLLDDDVRVDRLLLDRLTSLLAYLERPAIVGGQMLDIFDPTALGASHETVELDRLSLDNPLAGADLADPAAPALFARPHASDYNGWWCCCLPVERLRDGLPLPMFLGHDDIEYGAGGGVRVVTMPGIFVWHQTFRSKRKPWYAYYDRRNMLITAALHGRVRSWRLALQFARDCGGALRKHRYEFCWAACRAVDDFLRGPAHVFADPRERHREIVAGVAREALATMRSHRARAGRPSRPLIGWMLRRDDPAQVVAAPARAVARRIVTTTWRLLCDGDRATRSYRAQAYWYRSPSFWHDYLGLSGARP
jgi:galactofuranosylgalactofuranosylrhamnosyl-N-acetylglucosaminyl-diphospho-decaprenol beta-1,5/1,6-galactofuranosyltransferase